MQSELAKILAEAKEQMTKAASLPEAEDLRVRFLGKKSQLTEILRSMGGLSPEERKALGQEANTIRQEIEGMISEKLATLKKAERNSASRRKRSTSPSRERSSSSARSTR